MNCNAEDFSITPASQNPIQHVKHINIE